MKRNLFISVVLLTVLLAALYPMPAGATSVDSAEKAVILSIDGAKPEFIRQMIAEGELPNIKKAIESGVMAEYGVGVFPSVTAVSHAALTSGANPGSTGITSNSFYDPSKATRSFSTLSGFSSASLLSEPLWRTTHKAGLPTIVLSFGQATPSLASEWLGISGYDASMSSSNLFYYSTTGKTYDGGKTLAMADATGWNITVKYYGTPKMSKITLGLNDFVAKKTVNKPLYILILDTSDDGKVNYDKVYISEANSTATGPLKAVLSAKAMSSPVNIKAEKVTGGVLLKVMELTPDLSDFSLYQSIIYGLSDFASRPLVSEGITGYAGPFFGDGDSYGLEHGWIDPDTYMETVDYVGKWFTKATEYLLLKQPWKVIFTYQVVVDNVQHEFLGQVTPGHPRYKEADKAKYWEYIKRAYRHADDYVGVALKNVDSKTLVVIVSDHGFAPISKNVRINTYLKEQGFQVWEPGKLVVNFTATKAYYTRDCHVYINLKGRDYGGIVEPKDYNALVDQIVGALQNLTDPATGSPVFNYVMRSYYMTNPDKLEAITIGADFIGFGGPASTFKSSRIGDIIVSIKLGYYWDRSISTEVFEDTPEFYTGSHGYQPNLREMGTTFIASGPGIRKLGLAKLIKPTRIIDVAPTVAYLLGVPFPSNAEGRIILEALETSAQEDVMELSQKLYESQTKITELEGLAKNIKDLQAALDASAKTVDQVGSSLRTVSYLFAATLVVAAAAALFTFYKRRQQV